MILAEQKIGTKTGNHKQTLPQELQPEQQDAYGREELEKIAVSRKPFRELSCNSNVRTKLEPDDDREVLRRLVCVKLKDDIHSPGELNGQMMVLKEHVKARYRLSDLIRAQKNDKMTSKLSPNGSGLGI